MVTPLGTVEEIKNLCYQCEFHQVVESVNSINQFEIDPEDYFTLQLFKSQALFEMHRVSSSKSLLRDLAKHQPNQSDKYLYVMAKLCYLDQDYSKAERLFLILSDRSESVTDYFKAILGLANTYYSLGRYHDIKKLLMEMEELADLVTLDEKLSYALIKANSSYLLDDGISQSKTIFHEVIKLAAQRKWTYFIVKSLYGLATLHKHFGNTEAQDATINILKCYLNTEEAVYLTYLVNERFKDQNISLHSTLFFDKEFKRIAVQGNWIPLHDKPLIYGFLELLHASGSFVSKKQIAESLWAHQPYQPKIHDPRIFDLARRIRTLIEPYENQPVCLLSGRFGYKLARSEIMENTKSVRLYRSEENYG